MGRDRAAGERARWMPATSGRARIPDARRRRRGASIATKSPRRRSRAVRAGARAPGASAAPPRRSPRRRRRRAAALRPLMRQADRAHRLARATIRRRCCARSARPTARRACRTRCAAPACTCSTRTRRTAAREFAQADPGDVIARRDGAMLRATVDGAVWITHLRARRTAPRTSSCRRRWCWARASRTCPRCRWRPTRPPTIRHGGRSATRRTGAVGYLHFPFYNGAMGTAQCAALRAALRRAPSAPDARDRADGRPGLLVQRDPSQPDRGRRRTRPRSRGATSTPWTTWCARSSTCDRQLTIAAHAGQCRRGRRLPGARRGPRLGARRRDPQPALQGHGQPVRLGILDLSAAAPRRRRQRRSAMMQRRLPIGARRGGGARTRRRPFRRDAGRASSPRSRARASTLAGDPRFVAPAATTKTARRAPTRRAKPLDAYRAEELARMRLNFFGFDPELPRRPLPLRPQGAAVADAAAPRPAPDSGLEHVGARRGTQRGVARFGVPIAGGGTGAPERARATPPTPATTSPRAPASRPATRRDRHSD